MYFDRLVDDGPKIKIRGGGGRLPHKGGYGSASRRHAVALQTAWVGGPPGVASSAPLGRDRRGQGLADLVGRGVDGPRRPPGRPPTTAAAGAATAATPGTHRTPERTDRASGGDQWPAVLGRVGRRRAGDEAERHRAYDRRCVGSFDRRVELAPRDVPLPVGHQLPPSHELPKLRSTAEPECRLGLTEVAPEGVHLSAPVGAESPSTAPPHGKCLSCRLPAATSRRREPRRPCPGIHQLSWRCKHPSVCAEPVPLDENLGSGGHGQGRERFSWQSLLLNRS